MAHQMLEMQAVESAASSRRDLVMRTLIVAGTLLVMAALAYDMVTARWVGAAGPHLALALIVVVLWIPAARRIRYLHLGMIYVLGLYAYSVLRSFADQTPIPIRAGYAIAIDRAMFLGHAPTQWLQERFFDPSRLHALDWLTVNVHWSYFALPHVAVALTYFWRRELFPRLVALILGTFYAGLVLYYLVPTMPPWLAADHGILPGVRRVMDFVGGQVDLETYSRAYDALGVPNAVAAMPSLHMGITFAVYLFMRTLNRWLGYVLLVYSGMMAFSLVYMGEHYVIDIMAGAATALLVFKVVQRLSGPLPGPEKTPLHR